MTWICGTGLEPSRTNCPPSSNVRYIACLIRWTPFCGTNLVMQPTFHIREQKDPTIKPSSFLTSKNKACIINC